MTLFRRPAVDFEATQFTGENYNEIRALTGIRIAPHDGSEIQIFNPIGTYLPEHLYNKESNPPEAELWVDSIKQWRPVYIGEWILSDNDEWITVTDEWIRVNCVELDEEMLELIRREEEPKTFHQDLTAMLNHHSMENLSGTPDFILANYLHRCLETYNATILARAEWRGERIDSTFDIKVDRKLPITVYDNDGGPGNQIGEVEGVIVWPGETMKRGPIVGLIPVFGAFPESGFKPKEEVDRALDEDAERLLDGTD